MRWVLACLAVFVLAACRKDEWGSVIGDEIWRRPVSEEGPAVGGLSPGSDGSVVVSLSRIENSQMLWDVVKLDTRGETQWIFAGETDGTAGFDPPAFDVTPEGDVLVATWLRASPDPAEQTSVIDLSRISPDGEVRWTRTVATASSGQATVALRAAPDGGCFLLSSWPDGDAVDLGGGAIDATPPDSPLVAHYDGNGAHVWSGAMPFGPDPDGRLLGFLLRGDELVVGLFRRLVAIDPTPDDGAVTLLWQVEVDMAQPQMMATEGEHLYVAGHDDDFDSVLASLGADGAEEWRAPVVGDSIRRVHVATDGEVFTAGYDVVDDNLQAFFVAAFDGDGWRRQRTDGWVELIVTDDAGRIYLGHLTELTAHDLETP